MDLSGMEKLVAVLRRKAAEAMKDGSPAVIVGYTAAYALWVHEAPMKLKGQPRRRPHKGRYWDPQGRAQGKFLEYPAKMRAREIANVIKEALRAGKTWAESLLLGGLFLQRESQKLVPVDSGNLKASAFTRLEQR